jgi:ATP-dependent Lon protease
MEIIELPGYTRHEKQAIAKQFLVPKQLSEHGLSPERLEFGDDAIDYIVDHYTREAGVRSLERLVASVCRAVAVRLAEGEDVQEVAGPQYVEEVLGPTRYENILAEKVGRPGVSMSVAWTPSGGDLMFVESTQMPGSGHIHLTGSVGDVMKESVYAAFTYIRARAADLGLDPEFLSKVDIHIHLPGGSIPKDGPAAGVAVFVSLASMLTKLSVRPDVGMSGEMTLRGAILRVEGIKEKCLAAHRAGLEHVLLPARNEPDLDEVPEAIKKDLHIHLVSRIDEVLPLVLELPPASLGTDGQEQPTAES